MGDILLYNAIKMCYVSYILLSFEGVVASLFLASSDARKATLNCSRGSRGCLLC